LVEPIDCVAQHRIDMPIPRIGIIALRLAEDLRGGVAGEAPADVSR
jgi:hypothetical protein